MSSDLTVERRNGVLIVTIDRPTRRNALSLALQQELADLWAEVRDDPEVRCVVLTGAGDAFCSGLDVADLAAVTGEASRARIEFCPAVTVPVPVVLAVNGLCVGAGLRFVADADIVLAAESAWFGDPHVSLGHLALPVALTLATKAANSSVASLFLAGRQERMPASRALAAGIVTEVVPDADLAARAADLAAGVADGSPTAVRATVAALRERTRRALGDQLDHAWAATLAQRAHPDAAEGAAAAAQRRRPRWATP